MKACVELMYRPTFGDQGTSWISVSSFTPRSLNPPGKEPPPYLYDWRLRGHRDQFGRLGDVTGFRTSTP
jgi:hypothetical protein